MTYYWQHRVFAGREIPPPLLHSDEEVLQYVRRHQGAVGYVSVEVATPGVKTVELR